MNILIKIKVIVEILMVIFSSLINPMLHLKTESENLGNKSDNLFLVVLSF
jgi:hypothetical protein